MTINTGRIIGKLFAASAKISFSIPLCLKIATKRGDKGITAYVEFAIFVK